MASILSLKRRINAAKNVAKTTKALQMISASKMKRAQSAVLAARPYVQKIREIATIIKNSPKGTYTHPYLSKKSDSGKTLLLVLSPDKGLCGSLITNLTREFFNYKKTGIDTSYIIVGKKLEGRIVQVSEKIIASFVFGTTLPKFDIVYPLIRLIDDYYSSGKVDEVKVLTTEYNGVFKQVPKIVSILPILESELINDLGANVPFIYEPSEAEILNSLLKHYLEMVIYQQLIESFVSEQAARMIAMQNATDNASDIIESLYLEYNKSRQNRITNELLDISGGLSIKNE